LWRLKRSPLTALPLLEVGRSAAATRLMECPSVETFFHVIVPPLRILVASSGKRNVCWKKFGRKIS
jgi:hypothetical protein